MKLLTEEITLDRLVRGLLMAAIVAALCYALYALSPVLIPFFVAWALAFLLHPVVDTLQHRLHIRPRMLCVVLTLLGVLGVLTLFVLFCAPVIAEQWEHLRTVAVRYFGNLAERDVLAGLPAEWQAAIYNYVSGLDLAGLMTEDQIVHTAKMLLPKVWGVVQSTASIIVWLGSTFFALLYLVFLLADYDKYTTRWLDYVPRSRRAFFQRLMSDIAEGMSGYLRGQSLVALSNCVMFSLGFVIIGLPMPIGMGCLIGLISFVPYIQVLGFVPCAVLCLLKAAEVPGTNFWVMMSLVVVVYCVVQVLQDAVVTPRVMGHITGLSPAIILLALSVWGYMLGIIGLIVALPMTAILIAYYKQYIIGDSGDDNATPE